jgi:hypothetical protein
MKYDLRTKDLAYKRYKYIKDECMTELNQSIYTIEFQMGLLTILCTFWLRMFVHYLGGYLVCLFMKVPVVRFDAQAFKVYFDYAAYLLMQEYIITVAGVGTNFALFFLMAFLSWFGKTVCDCMPRRWY